MEAVRVLVTALNGDLGQAILKSLRLSRRHVELVGADLRSGSGSVFVDEFSILPPAGPVDRYLKELDRCCRERKIDVVIPGCEPEQRVLAELGEGASLPGGARIVSQGVRVQALCGDKLETYRFLKEVVPLADFADGNDPGEVSRFLAENSFPLCVKERVSSGQKGVVIVEDQAALDEAQVAMEKPVLQALIRGDDEEFSVGVFRHDGEVRLISFRRRLEGQSCSWWAELDQSAEVLDYSRRIAEAIPGEGSINIQLRMDAGNPKLLEINPRFSSLAAARAECGFNDVEWSLLATLGEPLPGPTEFPPVFRFQRFLGEVVDRGNGWQSLSRWSTEGALDRQS